MICNLEHKLLLVLTHMYIFMVYRYLTIFRGVHRILEKVFVLAAANLPSLSPFKEQKYIVVMKCNNHTIWKNNVVLKDFVFFNIIIIREIVLYRVFIKYCVFSKILIYFPDSCFTSVSVCVHTPGRQNTSACSRTGKI